MCQTPYFINQNEFMRLIGKNLKAARQAQNRSLEDLAEKTGYQIKTLQKIENAQRGIRLKAIYKVLSVLKLPPKMLFCD